MDFYLCGEKGLAALQYALEFGFEVENLIVAKDDGLDDQAYLKILNLASSSGLQIHSRDLFFENSNIAIAVGWKWLITLDYERLYVIHDSLLPKYRGWNPLVSALQNGDTEIGVTLILADAGIDTGPIVNQIEIPISYPITIREAIQKVLGAIGVILKNFKQLNMNHPSTLTIQDESKATYSLWRDKYDYFIDWTCSARRIVRFIDSLSEPYDGACSTLQGVDVRIFNAHEVSDLNIVNRQPGKIWRITREGPIVVCGSGLLQLRKIRAEGEDLKLSRIRQRFQ